MSSSACEWSLIYGGDLQIAANGDIQLSQDTPNGPQATFERVLRIVLTNPITKNDQGIPVVRPDDLFHVNFGAGARAAIGEPYTPALVKAMNARIIAALNADPYIQQNSISITWAQGQTIGSYYLTVACTSVLGEPWVFPPIPLAFPSS